MPTHRRALSLIENLSHSAITELYGSLSEDLLSGFQRRRKILFYFFTFNDIAGTNFIIILHVKFYTLTFVSIVLLYILILFKFSSHCNDELRNILIKRAKKENYFGLSTSLDNPGVATRTSAPLLRRPSSSRRSYRLNSVLFAESVSCSRRTPGTAKDRVTLTRIPPVA